MAALFGRQAAPVFLPAYQSSEAIDVNKLKVVVVYLMSSSPVSTISNIFQSLPFQQSATSMKSYWPASEALFTNVSSVTSTDVLFIFGAIPSGIKSELAVAELSTLLQTYRPNVGIRYVFMAHRELGKVVKRLLSCDKILLDQTYECYFFEPTNDVEDKEIAVYLEKSLNYRLRYGDIFPFRCTLFMRENRQLLLPRSHYAEAFFDISRDCNTNEKLETVWHSQTQDLRTRVAFGSRLRESVEYLCRIDYSDSLHVRAYLDTGIWIRYFSTLGAPRCFREIYDRRKGLLGNSCYDMVLDFDSVRSICNKDLGWKLFMQAGGLSQKKYRLVGITGGFNGGKTWLLNRLTNRSYPSDVEVRTSGLSFAMTNVVDEVPTLFVDSAGHGTPSENIEERFEERSAVERMLLSLVTTITKVQIVVLGKTFSWTDQEYIRELREEIGESPVFVVHNFVRLRREEADKAWRDIASKYAVPESVLSAGVFATEMHENRRRKLASRFPSLDPDKSRRVEYESKHFRVYNEDPEDPDFARNVETNDVVLKELSSSIRTYNPVGSSDPLDKQLATILKECVPRFVLVQDAVPNGAWEVHSEPFVPGQGREIKRPEGFFNSSDWSCMKFFAQYAAKDKTAVSKDQFVLAPVQRHYFVDHSRTFEVVPCLAQISDTPGTPNNASSGRQRVCLYFPLTGSFSENFNKAQFLDAVRIFPESTAMNDLRFDRSTDGSPYVRLKGFLAEHPLHRSTTSVAKPDCGEFLVTYKFPASVRTDDIHEIVVNRNGEVRIFIDMYPAAPTSA